MNRIITLSCWRQWKTPVCTVSKISFDLNINVIPLEANILVLRDIFAELEHSVFEFPKSFVRGLSDGFEPISAFHRTQCTVSVSAINDKTVILLCKCCFQRPDI
jgi:hypothetical protein